MRDKEAKCANGLWQLAVEMRATCDCLFVYLEGLVSSILSCKFNSMLFIQLT